MTIFNASIVTEEVYNACNKYNFFTSGTDKEYEALFDFIRKHANSDNLKEDFCFLWFCKQITNRIAEHTTNTDKETIMFIIVQAIAPYYFNYND